MNLFITIAISCLISFIISAISFSFLNRRNRNLEDKYNAACENIVEKSTIINSLDGFANRTEFKVYENLEYGCFEVIGNVRYKAYHSIPIIIKRFDFPSNNRDEYEYAEICANELCDMLNSDYVENNKR